MADLSFARSGLFTNRPEQVAGHRAWAEEQYGLDPEMPMKRVYHPVVRRRWGELLIEQADAELDVVREMPVYVPPPDDEDVAVEDRMSSDTGTGEDAHLEAEYEDRYGFDQPWED